MNMTETTETTAPAAPEAAAPRPTEITRIRFTSELGSYGDIQHLDLPKLQGTFRDSLMAYFKGRVPVGTKMPFIGIQVQSSRDKVVGTCIAGSVLVYLGVNGEDAERACNGYMEQDSRKKDHPYTWWEIITEETEKKHAEEKAERRAYSQALSDGVSSAKAKFRESKKSSFSTGSFTSVGGGSSFESDDDEDPNDLF